MPRQGSARALAGFGVRDPASARSRTPASSLLTYSRLCTFTQHAAAQAAAAGGNEIAAATPELIGVTSLAVEAANVSEMTREERIELHVAGGLSRENAALLVDHEDGGWRVHVAVDAGDPRILGELGLV